VGATFDEMHPSMAKLPSQDAAALAYAEVYTLVAWLHSKIGYRGVREVLSAQRDGKSARRAVAEALSMSWVAVEKAWHAHLRTQPAAAATARAGKPIRFSRGGVDSENVGLEQVGARARKHARLGGMLRARRMLEAAAIEYEKALAIGGTEPFVAAKLARTLVEIGGTGAAPAAPAPAAPAAPGHPPARTPIDRAIELATPLAAADPHDAAVAVTLGLARSTRQEWPQAIAAYEQALRVSPFDPTTRCGLAEAYAKTSDPRAARERAACDQLKH
jgi:tetratricopeptide (TPR) repeat protein